MEYYSLLNGVTQDENWEDWVLFILDAIESTSQWTLKLIHDIRKMQEETIDLIQSQLPRLPARDLAHLLFTQPYLRYANVVDACNINRQTAARWMNDLKENDVVTRVNIGRHVVFLNERFLNVLFSQTRQ